MNTYKSEWEPSNIKGFDNKFSVKPEIETISQQPTFGIAISWNEPFKPWKPFFIIDFWHWHLNIGWLCEQVNP